MFTGFPLYQAGASAQDCSSPHMQWMASRLLVRKEADMLCVERRLAGESAMTFKTAKGRVIKPRRQRAFTFSQKRKFSAADKRDAMRVQCSRGAAKENGGHAVCVRPTRKRSRGEQLVSVITGSTS